MRVLFVLSEALIGADLACRLKKEGHEVRVFIDSPHQSECLDGVVEKTLDWRGDLEWVGKSGLVVFDDVGYGAIQDDLRKDGYRVVGGSLAGDKLELNREFGQWIFSQYGMSVAPLFNFESLDESIQFVKKQKGAWVVKQSDHQCTLNYVGIMDDGSDVLSILENYKRDGVKKVSLQKKLEGVEVAVGRYFNGNNWLGPVCVNFEHKPLFNGNIGPMTGEMGTLMWYEEEDKSVFFHKVLSGLAQYLKESGFKGYVDVNCIVNQEGAWPLEATMRFGCPLVNLQTELQLSPWGEVLEAIADGEDYDMKYKKKYGIVVTVAVPPFPFFLYSSSNQEYSSRGVRIFLKSSISNDEMDRLCFQQVRFDGSNYCVSGVTGEALFVTGSGETVENARNEAYSLIQNVVIPKMFYRTDIGERFINKDHKALKGWGWIK